MVVAVGEDVGTFATMVLDGLVVASTFPRPFQNISELKTIAWSEKYSI